MSASLSPLAHISNTDLRPLLRNLVDCAIPPAISLKLISQVSLVKTAIPKLAFVCSSQRVLPIEELQVSVDDGGPSDVGVYNHSHCSDMSYLNNGSEVACGSLNSPNEKVLKERIRRMKIGLANKGRVPWNKGRKHTAETRERIRQRTLEALRDPKVRKKMAEHPHHHSDQIKKKISYSLRRVWQERRKSKQLRDKFFLSWEQSIANGARKGVNGQEELDWDSYNKIKQQLESLQLLLAEKEEKEKLVAIAGSKIFMQSWRESIANVAKKGGSGETELDWGSYKMIKQEMFRLYQLQHNAKRAKAKETARVKTIKAARIKAIKKVMLTQKRKICQARIEEKEDVKIQPLRKVQEGKVYFEDTEEFKPASKFTKIDINKNIINQGAREGDVLNSIFPININLDIELIKREKVQKEVSLADQIKAARNRKAKLH